MRTCSACQDETSNNSVLRRTSANMPRVRWRSVPVLCLILKFFWIVSVTADCWFENEKHKEGHEVPTAEPCLNCTCTQGALVCYLRVCTELPDPPPPGCIILHRHRTCCPELICADIPAGNGIEARSEPDELEIGYKKSSLGNGCIENGTIYGPGSAMGSSSLCEYCYCIGGRQTCIRPRCLLSLEGCAPTFEPHSCCPVRYNCTGYYISPNVTSSTTTQPPKDFVVRGGCIVSGIYYTEGSRVLGIGHSACDNCYCLRGVLRCEPLSCAPAILGCTPVIKPGECCAASYNCNGTIEIQPEPNYGHYPTISKEYAKLRKEVQERRPPVKSEKRTDSDKSNITYYVIAESTHTSTTKTHRSPGSFGTTRHILDPSTKGPFYYNTMSSTRSFGSANKNKQTTNSDAVLDIRTRPSTTYRKNNMSLAGVSYGTTNYQFQNTNYKRPFLTTNIPKGTEPTTTKYVNSITLGELTTPKQLRSSDYESISGDVFLSLVDSLFDNEINTSTELQNSTEKITNFTSKTASTEIPTIVTTHIIRNNASTVMNFENLTSTHNLKSKTEGQRNETQEESFNLTDVISTLISTLTEEETGTISDLDATNTTTVLPITTAMENLPTTMDIETTDITETTETELKMFSNSTTLTAMVTTTDCIKIDNDTNTAVINNTSIINFHEKLDQNVTAGIALTSTEINDINNELEGKTSETTSLTSEDDDGTSTITAASEKDITEVDLESKVKVDTITVQPFKKISSDIEAILNIPISKNKNKDYEDYDDYNEPTLPPSLPNLRIIPFVAADALDSKKQEHENTVYSLPHKRITESPPYSLFSPPTKTEGGFVPKEPPILHDYYENGYHTTGIDITSVTTLPVPAITNPPKTHEHNCIGEGREIRHGETVTAEGCIICVCFYGSIICQQPQCPPPGPGCRRSTRQETATCCPPLICDTQEAPTVVLDRIDVTSNPQEIITVAEGVATPDPFRDVIRTEPAPNLQSLIGDIMPYLARHSTTQKMSTTADVTTEMPENVTAEEQTHNATTENEEFSFNKVLELLFYGDTTTEQHKEITKSVETTENPNPKHESLSNSSESPVTYSNLESKEILESNIHQQNHPNSVDSAVGVGLLKLAGCNIYGRMYRVGRIISELSGPCLECKCTEVGVQCTPLKC